MVPPRSAGDDFLTPSSVNDPRTTPAGGRRSFGEDNVDIVRGMPEVAAAVAMAAVHDVQRHGIGRKNSTTARPPPPSMPTAEEDITAGQDAAGHGGHDAPNWSKGKSSIILLGATVLYAVIAEILVNTVDVVLENLDIDEKFLGITLFALVPNTTEFLVSCLSSATIVGTGVAD
jgi:Ca2+:H+ antiporter